MAWMSDEAWEMVSDSIDKKKTARSARSTRTHCGKRGRVKFPSDYMSKKELKAMNGNVETYRMNEPMSWEEFVKMPLDLQRTYIDGLRKRFNAPDAYIAEMFDKSGGFFIDHLFRLKMSTYTPKEGETWDREGFMAWRLGVEDPKAEQVPVNENKEDNTVDILDRPMNFKQFVALTDEQKKTYIETLRQKFDVPNSYIAKMLECSSSCIARYNRILNIGYSRPIGSRRAWNETGWNAWLKGANQDTDEKEKEKLDNFVQDLIGLSQEVAAGAKKPYEEPQIEVVTAINEPEMDATKIVEELAKMVESKKANDIHECACEKEKKRAVPNTGEMSFVGNIDDILNTIELLLRGANVAMEVKWMITD